MAGSFNYYYNPEYAAGAKELADAIRGKTMNPNEQAEAQLNRAKTDEQYMKNRALSGFADTIRSGDDAATIAAEAQGGLNAMNFQPPILASRAAHMAIDNGAPPADVYGRQALISHGDTPGENFAVDPARADQIAQNKFAADQIKDIAVQRVKNAGDKAAKPVKVGSKDAEQFLIDALGSFPGATERNVVQSQYGSRVTNNYIPTDVRDTLATSGLLDKALRAGSDAYRSSQGDDIAARQAVIDTLHFPVGTHFRPATPGTHRSLFHPLTADTPDQPADFVDQSGQSTIAAALAPSAPVGQVPGGPPPEADPTTPPAPGPAGLPPSGGTLDNPVMVTTPGEAAALPSGTVFIVKGRPDLKPKRVP